MIKYYTNRTLAGKLGTNLAKWKRWSREFLPPDPLGGIQSGYARQYTPDEAFTVCLGGHLVADLHFSIPAARQILADLAQWLMGNGYSHETRQIPTQAGLPALSSVTCHMIFITPARSDGTTNTETDAGLHYRIRGILSTETTVREGARIVSERFVESSLPGSASPTMALADIYPVSVLNITALLKNFAVGLGLDQAGYPALSSATS